MLEGPKLAPISLRVDADLRKALQVGVDAAGKPLSVLLRAILWRHITRAAAAGVIMAIAASCGTAAAQRRPVPPDPTFIEDPAEAFETTTTVAPATSVTTSAPLNVTG